MVSLSCYSVLFSLMIIFLCTHPAMSDPNSLADINKICRQTEDFGFCNTTFNQNVYPPETTLASLAQVTIKLALNNATNTHAFVVELLESTTNGTEKDYLTVCENSYHIVMDSFQQAAKAFDAADYRSMFQYEQGTPRAAASCVTIFETPPNPPNPLNERNREMRILISMAVFAAYDLAN